MTFNPQAPAQVGFGWFPSGTDPLRFDAAHPVAITVPSTVAETIDELRVHLGRLISPGRAELLVLGEEQVGQTAGTAMLVPDADEFDHQPSQWSPTATSDGRTQDFFELVQGEAGWLEVMASRGTVSLSPSGALDLSGRRVSEVRLAAQVTRGDPRPNPSEWSVQPAQLSLSLNTKWSNGEWYNHTQAEDFDPDWRHVPARRTLRWSLPRNPFSVQPWTADDIRAFSAAPSPEPDPDYGSRLIRLQFRNSSFASHAARIERLWVEVDHVPVPSASAPTVTVDEDGWATFDLGGWSKPSSGEFTFVLRASGGLYGWLSRLAGVVPSGHRSGRPVMVDGRTMSLAEMSGRAVPTLLVRSDGGGSVDSAPYVAAARHRVRPGVAVSQPVPVSDPTEFGTVLFEVAGHARVPLQVEVVSAGSTVASGQVEPLSDAPSSVRRVAVPVGPVTVGDDVTVRLSSEGDGWEVGTVVAGVLPDDEPVDDLVELLSLNQRTFSTSTAGWANILTPGGVSLTRIANGSLPSSLQGLAAGAGRLTIGIPSAVVLAGTQHVVTPGNPVRGRIAVAVQDGSGTSDVTVGIRWTAGSTTGSPVVAEQSVTVQVPNLSWRHVDVAASPPGGATHVWLTVSAAVRGTQSGPLPSALFFTDASLQEVVPPTPPGYVWPYWYTDDSYHAATVPLLLSTAPPVPTSLTVTQHPDTGHALLSWSGSADRFRIRRGGQVIAETDGNSYVDPERANRTETYTVQAVRDDGAVSQQTSPTAHTFSGKWRFTTAIRPDMGVNVTVLRDGHQIEFLSDRESWRRAGTGYTHVQRGLEDRGTAWAARLFVEGTGGQAIFDALRNLIDLDVPYIAVCDPHGNRWLADVHLPSGNLLLPHVGYAQVEWVETHGVPVPVVD